MNRLELAQNYVEQYRNTVDQNYRMMYHVMTPIGWMNDPNGFTMYKDEYHLFYQYHPYSSVWGPMHWGHYKSKDLIKWEELPIALAPENDYEKDGCFSGNAIEDDCKLYLLYTGHHHPDVSDKSVYKQTQCLAVSEDGISFEKSKNNPVITTDMLPENAMKMDFRDPKVWKKDGIFYCIVSSKNTDESGQILMFKSSDMENWTFVNTVCQSDNKIGKMWECPDMFEMDDRDFLLVSPMFLKRDGYKFFNIYSSVYMEGNLDYEKGKFSFNNYSEIDYGLDFYAPQTIKDHEGRRIMTAWMQTWERTYPSNNLKQGWAGALILPRELSFENNMLIQKPIREIENYRTNEVSYENITLSENSSYEGTSGDVVELQVSVDLSNAEEFGMKVLKCENEETVLYYNKKNGKFTFDRENGGYPIKGIEEYSCNKREVPVELEDNRLNIRVFIDKVSVEVFLQEGKKTMTSTVFPMRKGRQIEFYAKGKANIIYLKKWDL